MHARLVPLLSLSLLAGGCDQLVEYDEPVPERFSVVVLPDTQYYTQDHPEIFLAQTDWIVEQADHLDIRAVVHVGDLVEHGDGFPREWEVADAALRRLEVERPGSPAGIPFGIAPGNHDQTPEGTPGGTASFNDWFGVGRFANRLYYGGACGSTNDNSFFTFEAGALRFVVLLVAYDPKPDPAVLEWMRQVLRRHPDHLGILAAHHVIGREAQWSDQGKIFFDAVREEPGMRLVLAGHVRGEARRVDDGIDTLLADYQGRENGGNGWLRLLTFRPGAGRLDVQTYSPFLDEWERDADSELSLPFDFGDAVVPD